MSGSTLIQVVVLVAPALVAASLDRTPLPTHADAWGADLGVLDVTAAPFHVDSGGAVDVTASLQSAIQYAHDHFLAVYLPHGEYLVSDTLRLYANDSREEAGWINNTWPCRFQPNVMLGARARWSSDAPEVPTRPTIRLADHAPGFSGPDSKPVLDFTRSTGSKPVIDGTNFNQLLRGVDVRIGAGTPWASGVQMPGAQGCSVQDVTVRMGSGYAGIVGGSGAGGSHTNVRVEGGRVGLDYTISLNAPATNGATLLGQTEASILYVGLEAASFVGAYIAPASRSVPALRSVRTGTMYGQVSLVDSVVAYPAGDEGNCTAFDTLHSLYLRRVHVRGCAVVLDCDGRSAAAGGGAAWTEVRELAKGVPIPDGQQCAARFGGAAMPIYLDGARQSREGVGGTAPCAWLVDMGPSASGPPPSLTAKHTWDERTFPTFDLSFNGTWGKQIFNVGAAPYGAVGDGTHDDTEALQRAIDDAARAAAQSAGASAVVFVPKGFYRLSRTLNLTAARGTSLALLGIARHLSVLMPMSDGLVGMQRSPAPILQVGASDGVVQLSMFTIVTWEHLSSVWAMEWMNRNAASVYRQNYFFRITECLYGFPHPLPTPVQKPTMPCKAAATLAQPLNVVSGSGRFYNFENEDFLYEAKQYRHLVVTHEGVEDEGQEVHLYSMNFEHASSSANAAIVNARNVHIYSFKTEGEWHDMIDHKSLHNPAYGLYIANSSEVNVYSHGGNMRARPWNSSLPARAVYRIEGTCPLRLTNLVDQFQFPPDDDWSMVAEVYNGTTTRTAPCDRPVLFRRTRCGGAAGEARGVVWI